MHFALALPATLWHIHSFIHSLSSQSFLLRKKNALLKARWSQWPFACSPSFDRFCCLLLLFSARHICRKQLLRRLQLLHRLGPDSWFRPVCRPSNSRQQRHPRIWNRKHCQMGRGRHHSALCQFNRSPISTSRRQGQLQPRPLPRRHQTHAWLHLRRLARLLDSWRLDLACSWRTRHH